ncbi:hypothetical protein PHYSODRAFT_294742 [Phytophthora sojae]|uniref:Uncharacterized protein n=1 Tax=Phytophthora sojae (strain P6497) TaxID=1094619 RepID=G4YJC5_PHYSP|nr:hypothetical protein PHYSODRAFT_294742 [Phytophthora sojae]EGZ29722.1 hypothetical protein PHYSODRAFT_294742 [Phytophthora sojae]|eukprot:XP_009516997.1 hypothetical protein PHYSODRAFT_294742 [Phytophthora sojae]
MSSVLLKQAPSPASPLCGKPTSRLRHQLEGRHGHLHVLHQQLRWAPAPRTSPSKHCPVVVGSGVTGSAVVREGVTGSADSCSGNSADSVSANSADSSSADASAASGFKADVNNWRHSSDWQSFTDFGLVG